MRGRLITIEGGEGAGKTTQAAVLQAFLTAHGLPCLLTREPGGTPFAEEVRRLLLAPPAAGPTPMAEMLLFMSARADHVERRVAPALAAGTWIISDRFTDSTYAYQGAASGVPATVIRTVEAAVLGDLTPDLTLLLDLPAEVGLSRVKARRQSSSAAAPPAAPDVYESRDLAYHQRLRDAFLAIAAAEPARCVVIDGNRPVREVSTDIEAAVRDRLGVR
jgi:dTMP kinase